MFAYSHEIWTFISIALKIVALVPYFIDIAKGKCHPHAFSWLIWFVLDFIAFLVQYFSGAGYGAWPTFVGAVIDIAVMTLGFLIGKRDIQISDYAALAAALMVIPLWYFVVSPMAVLSVVMIVDFIGFFPTWRKATLRPDEERSMTFVLLSISNIFAAFAVEVKALETMTYPIYVAITLMATALYVMMRHKKIHGYYNLIKKPNDRNNWFSED